jgi:hypothetical protein
MKNKISNLKKTVFSVLILFFLTLPCVSAHSQPIPQVEIIPLNYTDFSQIKKFTKLEIGIQIPKEIEEKVNAFILEDEYFNKEKINPFVEWELDLEILFKHLETGKIVKKDAFYYKEFRRNERSNYWDGVNTHFPMRVRFTPPLSGEWVAETILKVNNKTYKEYGVFHVNVIESNELGFVKIHSNKQNLQQGNDIIYPLGSNFPYPHNGNNMTWNWNPSVRLKMSAWTDYLMDLEDYNSKGGKYFRIMIAPSASDIEFEKIGNYYERLNYAWEIDQMLETCSEKNMMVQFCMMIHTPTMQAADYGQYSWDFSNFWHDKSAWPYKDQMPTYCYQSAFDLEKFSDIVNHKEALNYMKQRYRYMISRWGYSTNISFFELLSEPWHVDENNFNKTTPYFEPEGDETRLAVEKFHSEISKFIKEDLQHTDHLLGAIGHMPSKTVYSSEIGGKSGIKEHDKSWADKNIDLVCISTYNYQPDKLISSKNEKSPNNSFGEEEHSYAKVIDNLFRAHEKPVLISETGQGDGTNQCSEDIPHFIDAFRLGYTGLAGFNLWEGFIYSKSDSTTYPYHLWKVISNSHDRMNSEQMKSILQTKKAQGRGVKSSSRRLKNVKEFQYYIKEDLSVCEGYIYNRTYNIASNHTDSASFCGKLSNPNNKAIKSSYKIKKDLHWKKKKIGVEGLKANLYYTVNWYSCFESKKIQSECLKTNKKGILLLKHPTLFVSESSVEKNLFLPLVMYSITEGDCSKGIIEVE